MARVGAPGEPRVLPHVERQAPPPDRARPVRLRTREPHAGPVGRRRGDRVRRRPARSTRAASAPTASTLDELGSQIEQVQTTPGRSVQPLGQASFDAWIKHYRPDENSGNAAMSYYTKGCVVAFLLDAAIRRATSGARSLDDVMRAAFDRFSGARGYTEAEFRALASEVAGADLSAWLAAAIDTTGELDYQPALEWLGLRLRAEEPPSDRPPRAFLGVMTRNDGGRLLVTSVRAGTPAAAAGVSPDDEILAMEEYRVRADQLEGRLEMYRAGDPVSLLVARRERLAAARGHARRAAAALEARSRPCGLAGTAGPPDGVARRLISRARSSAPRAPSPRGPRRHARRRSKTTRSVPLPQRAARCAAAPPRA